MVLQCCDLIVVEIWRRKMVNLSLLAKQRCQKGNQFRALLIQCRHGLFGRHLCRSLSTEVQVSLDPEKPAKEWFFALNFPERQELELNS
jgi:hypothetical protein